MQIQDDYQDLQNPLQQDQSAEFDLKKVSPNRLSMGKRMSEAVPQKESMLPLNLLGNERRHSDNVANEDRHSMPIQQETEVVEDDDTSGHPQTNLQIPTLTNNNLNGNGSGNNNKVAYDENEAIFDIIKD